MSAASDHARGWLASCLLHLIGGAAALLVMGTIEQAVPPELFQWDISMVDSPTHAESEPSEPVVQPTPTPAKPSAPVRQAKRPVAEPPLPQTPTEATQVAQDVATHAEPVMEYAAVASTENQPIHSPPVIDASVESLDQPVIEERVPVESITPQAEHRPVQYRQIQHRETRADYGWLRDALWGRIEALKRYPAQARMNHWEGKVVVSAVIRDDGEVVGVQIAETSGQAVLDEEAIAVMKKASPLRLKHPLGQRQVTILIPINYRLDG
ncbi:MAG TPA: energy transducer TonB [Nitrospira sp.]|nr:energy transducer TonB [Nitrospira sp.]